MWCQKFSILYVCKCKFKNLIIFNLNTFSTWTLFNQYLHTSTILWLRFIIMIPIYLLNYTRIILRYIFIICKLVVLSVFLNTSWLIRVSLSDTQPWACSWPSAVTAYSQQKRNSQQLINLQFMLLEQDYLSQNNYNLTKILTSRK